MIVSDLKSVAKKSLMVHGLYKLFRDARDVRAAQWLEIGRVSSVVKVLPNTMLPMPRLFDAYEAICTINREGLQGDVVECGVWNGGCLGLMALANLKQPGPKRKFHLFDSFQGLPQPSSYDLEVIPGFTRRHPELDLRDKSASSLTAIGTCVGTSQKTVESFLTNYLGINTNDLVFHAGWFQDTIPHSRETITEIALLRLDGDWYESTKICLEGLYDRVVTKGYIIIDDYGTFSGCKKAVDDFFEKKDIQPAMAHSDSDCVFFRKQ